MRIQPFSFILGLGVAFMVPLFSKVLRPLAVEATAAGLGLVEEGRRILAEQMEVMEDIAAEARARREVIVAAGNGNGLGHEQEHGAEAASESEPAATVGRSRRRCNGTRRHAS